MLQPKPILCDGKGGIFNRQPNAGLFANDNAPKLGSTQLNVRKILAGQVAVVLGK
jgi:hypothetical protein